MNLIKPKPLEKGDTIGFLTVSGATLEIERVQKAKKYFEQLGYKVVFSDTTYTQKDFLSADDEVRLAQLHEFFADTQIDAILCTRGGYGATRLIKNIDYNLISNNPKFFGGFSDATAFLCAITVNSGLQTYHSPMPYSDFSNEEIEPTTETSFFEIARGNKFSTKLNGTVYKNGCRHGILWGGNLATLASMVGTNFVPDEKFIFFAEDINEPAYKIDRYLTQLSFDKKFLKNLAGIVLGDFGGLDQKDYFDNIFYEVGKKLEIPITSGLQIGHIKSKITIPLGINVNLDTEKSELYEI